MSERKNDQKFKFKPLTGEVLRTLAGVPSFPGAALPVVLAGRGVTQVDLRLTVVSREARRAAAPQPRHGVNRPEQHRVRRHERRRVVEPQHRHALHVILARLSQADVIVEGQHVLGGQQGEQRSVQVNLLLESFRGEETVRGGVVVVAPRPLQVIGVWCRRTGGLQSGEGDIQDASLDVSVILDVEHEDAVAAGGEDGSHAVHEEGEQRGQEELLGHVLQADRDAVGQHVVGDDGDAQGAQGRDVVDTIYEGREEGL